jgi:Asp-tRNA(Asn)/Glu-tRNA(Gln) amidotransferase C subunit
MPLDEKAKEELRELFKADPLKLISLTNLKTGDVNVALIASSIWDVTLRKYLKKGFIPTKVNDENIELINRWEVAEENVKDYTEEIKNLEDEIVDYSNTLQKIETDPFYHRIYTPSVFSERRDKAMAELEVSKANLENNKQKLPTLRSMVKKLRNFDYLRENKYI